MSHEFLDFVDDILDRLNKKGRFARGVERDNFPLAGWTLCWAAVSD